MDHPPLEPLYTLKVAAALIPFPSTDALRMYLYRHGFPKRYRQRGRKPAIRLVSLSECRQLRTMVVTTKRTA